MYSGTDNDAVLRSRKKKRAGSFKRKIDEIDENAFVIVGDARGSWEGFIEKMGIIHKKM